MNLQKTIKLKENTKYKRKQNKNLQHTFCDALKFVFIKKC